MERQHTAKTVTCQVCGQPKRLDEVLPGDLVRESVVEKIQQTCPEWSSSGYICLADLNHFRSEYIHDALEKDKGELTDLEMEVVNSLKQHELLSKNLNDEFADDLTLGERIADNVAVFGGSWRFIISFGVILVVWITINSVSMLGKPFDPFPFILLNLVLSCLAAIQAPIIMMSQNRQEAKDRLRSEHDYRVNLKAELEIRHLNEKLDHLIRHQWQRLMEIQQIQMELMEELASHEPQKNR